MAGIGSFDSFSAINEYLEAECYKHILKERHYKNQRPLCDLFDDLKSKLGNYNKGKVWGRWEDLKVNKFQQIQYQEKSYSVPLRFIGSTLKVFISVFSVEIYDDSSLVASHKRLHLGQSDSLVLDHYLDQLLRKPLSVDYASVIKNHLFADCVLELQRRLKNRYSCREANRHFVRILMLQRMSSKEDFEIAVQLALNYGGISFLGVKSILQQLQIDQLRNSIDVDYPVIDHHFNLDKYKELEREEFYND